MAGTEMRNKAKVTAFSSDARTVLMLLAAVVVWAASWPVDAYAECKWEWLCDASGEDCQKGAVCDSVDDTMPPPPSVPKPVVTASAPPPPTPGSAPEGSTDCRQLRRCDINGNCIWDILCLCL